VRGALRHVAGCTTCTPSHPSFCACVSSTSFKGAARIRCRPNMSADGCQQPAWTGQAFSYLMHHPSASSGEHDHNLPMWKFSTCAAYATSFLLTKPASHAACTSFCRTAIDRGQRGRFCSYSRQSGKTLLCIWALASAAQIVAGPLRMWQSESWPACQCLSVIMQLARPECRRLQVCGTAPRPVAMSRYDPKPMALPVAVMHC
jgi:hypothetical protein